MRVSSRRTLVPVLTGAILLAAGGVAWAVNYQAPPPVRPADAGLSGSVWVVPADNVASFLQQRGVTSSFIPIPGTAVVARVSWNALPNNPDECYTVLLGDALGRAGSVDATYGPPKADVSLTNGSMWNHVLRAHDWLAGDGPIALSDGGYTSHGQFASVPSAWRGDVWVIGHVVYPVDQLVATDETVDAPQPVVAIALSSGDHVWWVKEVARARASDLAEG